VSKEKQTGKKMPNDYFQFQQFRVEQGRAAMKVCTDACIFGAWVAELLDQQEGRLLDIGTGTGLLSLMTEQKCQCKIDAVDIDEEAVEQAKLNFLSSPWSDRLRCMQADVRTFHTDELYDVIISNPPFYELYLRSSDSRTNDALHSERLSLLDSVRVIKLLLKSDGVWGVLLPYTRVDYFLGECIAEDWKVLRRLDIFNEGKEEPFRSCIWLGYAGDLANTERMTIRESGIYTYEFRKLLGSYYLAFQA